MAERWVKGELTGSCVGTPTRGRGGTGLARWYRLELVDAVVSQWTPVAGPPPLPAPGQQPFRQARVEEAVLRPRTTGGPEELVALADAGIWSWRTRDQVEEDGESRCTLEGTVYARVVERGAAVRRRPARGGDGAPVVLDRAGCLGLALGLLVASWLWWSCGAVTSLLWTVGVLASWWTLAARHRRQPPLTRWVSVGHGLLGALLILAAAGAALELLDPARLATCGPEDGLGVLLAMGALLGASLLAVSWPLPWVWGLWTVVMLLWCGRSGTDCAGHWLQRGYQGVRGVAPRQVEELEQRLEDLKERLGLGGPPAPAPAGPTPSGGADGGTPDGGGGAGGRGGAATGSGGAPGVKPGPGGAGKPGAGPGGGPRTGRPGAGDAADGLPGGAPGKGEAQGGGPARGAAGTTGRGTPGSGQAPPEDGEERSWASQLRVTIEAALLDPAAFFGGGQRVTLGGDLLFEFDEDVLRPEAVPKLKQVARLLRLDPRKRVLLEGHADTVGGDAYNQDLSERRAAAVKTWLVETAHINPSQIDTVGFGSARPIAPVTAGAAGQAQNRRVEVRVLP